MHSWALWSVYESVKWLQTLFGWLDFPGNQVWHFRNRFESDCEVGLGLWTLPVIQESIHFALVDCAAREEHVGTREDITDQVQVFCRNLWFWCTQKEGMQFTASVGSYFYAELSEKKPINTWKKSRENGFCLVLFCRALRGQSGDLLLHITASPSSIL